MIRDTECFVSTVARENSRRDAPNAGLLLLAYARCPFASSAVGEQSTLRHSDGGQCRRTAVLLHAGGCVRSLLSGSLSPWRSIPSPDMSADCSAPTVRLSRIRTASCTWLSRSECVLRSDHHELARLHHSQLEWVPWREGISDARGTPAKFSTERPSFDRAGRGKGCPMPARCDPVPEMFHVKQPVGVSRSVEDRRSPDARVVEP